VACHCDPRLLASVFWDWLAEADEFKIAGCPLPAPKKHGCWLVCRAAIRQAPTQSLLSQHSRPKSHFERLHHSIPHTRSSHEAGGLSPIFCHGEADPTPAFEHSTLNTPAGTCTPQRAAMFRL
jgi:hypothetical protein